MVSPEKEIPKERIEWLMKKYEEYAKENGFRINSNRKVAETIVRRLLENEEKFGFRYCPCRRTNGDPHEDRKIICPCVFHKDEIKKQGKCHCMLFVE